MIQLSVLLPVFKGKDIAWLAMEGLCRQKDIAFDWELVIAEEQQQQYDPCGKKFFTSYSDRLKQVRCCKVKYIKAPYHIALSRKWKVMAAATEQTSKVGVLQAADCYSEPNRLATAHRALYETEYNWLQSANGFFYDIFSGRFLLYSHNTNDKFTAALNMSTRLEVLRTLKDEDKGKSVDRWLLSHIDTPHIAWDTSSNWKKGIDTNGLNTISINRAKYFKDHTLNKSHFFTYANPALDEVVPSEVAARLEDMRRETIHFVWVYAQSPARWREVRHSIASVKKYCKQPYELFVVGDHTGIMKDVRHILMKKQGDRANDISLKLRRIISTPEINDDFVYMYDDQVFLKDFRYGDLNVVRAMEPFKDFDSIKEVRKKSGVWWGLMKDTFKRLQKETGSDKQLYNYETHFPRVYNKERLKEVMDTFNMDTAKYLLASLYFNTYYDAPDELLSEVPLKASFYAPTNNNDRIAERTHGRLVLNYNDAGLNEELKAFIKNVTSTK